MVCTICVVAHAEPENPLHLRITNALRAEIADGRYAETGRLPSERELASRFQVSRATLRQGLDSLARAGLIERRLGRNGGAFLTEPRVALDGLGDLSKALRGIARSGLRVLEAVERQPTAREVPVLGDGAVISLTRLRLANAMVLGLEHVALVSAAFPGLLEHPLAGDLELLLRREYTRLPVRSEEQLEPTTARATEAEPLEVSPGTPLFLVRRVSFDKDGRALTLAHDLYRGDRLRISWSGALRSE